MISEPELARLAALIAQCSLPHCGNGPRNSLTSALHQCAPALIPELQRLNGECEALQQQATSYLTQAREISEELTAAYEEIKRLRDDLSTETRADWKSVEHLLPHAKPAASYLPDHEWLERLEKARNR